jgi:TonB-dependent receptor
MGNLRLDRLSLLGGLRFERTAVSGRGSLQINNSQQLSVTTREADYTRSFPSLHARYTLTPNLLLRASWSTGVGRPSISQLVPTTTVTTSATTGLGTVNANNVALRPMFSDNFDLACEYYAKEVGLITVGVFQKNIDGFINRVTTLIGTGSDNGFGGQYADFNLVTQENLASARVRGAEFNFSHDLAVLSPRLRGVSLLGNLTWLETSGQFNDGLSQLPGFKPIVANAGVSARLGRLQVRVFYNYAAGFLASYNADPTLRNYSTEDKTVDVNLQYRFSPRLTIFADVNNVFNFSPGQPGWIINPNYVLTDEYNGPRLNVGVSGRF